METTKPSPRAASLAGPRLPADQGLSSLGLLMQLIGSASLGIMAYLMLLPLFANGGGGWQPLLLGASGIIRAAFHRAAGSSLLYGGPTPPRRALRAYFVIALAETAVWVFVMVKSGVPLKGALPVIGMLLSWPVALQIITSRPRFQAILDEIPQTEDLGFEGAGVLMLILGVIGSLVAAFVVFAMFKLGGEAVSSPQGIVVTGVFLMLLARSVIHSIAGHKATSGVGADEASDAAARYFNFGVVSSVIAAGAMLVLMMMSMNRATGFMVGLIFVAFVLAWLLLWPTLLRRFYTDRNFAVLFAGNEGERQRRAPDAGMTALGWVLMGSAVFALGSAVPQLLNGADVNPFTSLLGAGITPVEGHSIWWSIGISGVQLWAGIELINMSDRYRIAANVYGGVAAAVTVLFTWPLIKAGVSSSPLFALGSERAMMSLIAQAGLAMALVVPAVTLVLANRKFTPLATARINQR